jgi:hypothetical protein
VSSNLTASANLRAYLLLFLYTTQMLKYIKLSILGCIFIALHAKAVDVKKPQAPASKEAVITTDKNGNTTVNIGKGNEVSNESGTVDGKKWVNTKKVEGPKGDSDEAFWGKGGFWGNGKSAP